HVRPAARDRAGGRGNARRMRRLVPALAVAVVAGMAFHALFLPAFEGPDEPHHLARILAFARGPLAAGWRARDVPGDVLGAGKVHPCSVSLRLAYGCPLFDGRGAGFDLLRAAPPGAVAAPLPNPEANHPPLAYAAMGLPLRLAPAGLDVPAALLYS